jgi:hypothetical protein
MLEFNSLSQFKIPRRSSFWSQCVRVQDMVWSRFLVLSADTSSKVTKRKVNDIVEKLPARPLKHCAKVVHILAPVCVTPSWAIEHCLLWCLWLFCQLYIFFFLQYLWRNSLQIQIKLLINSISEEGVHRSSFHWRFFYIEAHDRSFDVAMSLNINAVNMGSAEGSVW